MMKTIKSPNSRFRNIPFVNGYTDIEKTNNVFVIGNSDCEETIFGDNIPDHIEMLCKLSAKSMFPNVIITAGYRITPDGQDYTMQKNLYNGKDVNIKNIISEVDIEFIDIITHEKYLKCNLSQNQVIYRKYFQIQNKSKRLPNYPDLANHQSEIFMTKSDAYCFAGVYFDGVKLSDIQQYLFYVGTDINSKPYIKVISAQDFMHKNLGNIDKSIDIESLSSLEDDICDGKIKIIIGDIEYHSISAIKNTFMSNIFSIVLKK